MQPRANKANLVSVPQQPWQHNEGFQLNPKSREGVSLSHLDRELVGQQEGLTAEG